MAINYLITIKLKIYGFFTESDVDLKPKQQKM